MRRGLLLIVLLASIVAASAASGERASLRAQSFRIDDLTKLDLQTRAAVDWCGAGQPAAGDRKPDAELSSTRQVHVTYAIPADAADRFSSTASRIATDAEAMDAWWRGQDGTRTIRFDLFAFPGCATKFGRLDIGFIRLPRVGAQYVGDDGADRLLADLGQLAALNNKKHLVYYDGPAVFEQFVCGTSFVPRSALTEGGLAGIAFVWIQSLCGFDLGAGALNAAVAVHELIHGLGALVTGGAPNECDSPDDGHVCDNPLDVLYPEANSQTRIATQILDFNRDDYYGHSGAWFDVQDSIWLTHLPQFGLSIALQPTAGSGTVHVTSASPSVAPLAEPIECSQSCTVELDNGTPVVLVAAPRSGSRFVGWRDACSGTRSCSLVLDAAKSVTAVFGPATFRVTAGVSGKGKVTSAPAGIACPARCSASFKAGSAIRLRARAMKGYVFVRWSGGCRGAGSCTLTADRNRSARAIFRKKG